jgi:hypothetical protein
LRHCAISRKVAGWIPDRVIEIYLWQSIFVGSNLALAAMSKRRGLMGLKTIVL